MTGNGGTGILSASVENEGVPPDEGGAPSLLSKVIRTAGTVADLLLHMRGLTAEEQEILLDGCLMNYYAKRAD